MKIANVKERTIAESVCNEPKAAATSHVVVKRAGLNANSFK